MLELCSRDLTPNKAITVITNRAVAQPSRHEPDSISNVRTLNILEVERYRMYSERSEIKTA